MFPILHRKLIFPIIELVRGEPISKCLSELNKSQYYSYERIKELQWKKLKMLINHCYSNIPYYRKSFVKLRLKPEDIKSFDDFKNVPFLTKNIIRENQNEIVDSNFKGKVEHCKSGGTQGEPLNLIRDSLSSAYARAALYRTLGWYGIKKVDKQLRLWGIPLNPKLARKERLKNLLLNRKIISAFDISKKKVKNYYLEIKNFRPEYIYGYVSAIFRICQLMQESGFDGKRLNIKYVIATAESLDNYQKNIIETFLHCKVINEYGCSEMGPIASECPEGNLHINMENILVEFIENNMLGRENSEIVLTNLNSFSMPLLRYKIYDTGQGLTFRCPCGRGLSLMEFNAGRVVSTLVATDGRFVAGNFFRYLASDFIKKHKGIKDFRVVQKKTNKLEITLSQDENFNETLLNIFTSNIKAVLGTDMIIEYIFRDEIPLEKSGKRLYVSSELKEIYQR